MCVHVGVCLRVYPFPCPLKYLWSSFMYIFCVETLLARTSALCVGGRDNRIRLRLQP